MIINNRNKWDVLYLDNSLYKSMKIWCSLDDNHQGVANKAKKKLEDEGFYDVTILAVAPASKLYHVSGYGQDAEWKEEFTNLESAFIVASKAAIENTGNADKWCDTHLEEADVWFSSVNPMMSGNQILDGINNKSDDWE